MNPEDILTAREQSQESRPLVELERVWARYNREWVLKDINLKCYRSQIVGIVGPNGGGKTTLLRIIMGLKHADKGTVRIFGRSPGSGAKIAGRLGYLPQLSLAERNFPVSVLDVVLMGRYPRLGLFKKPGKDDRDAAMAALDKVGMAALAHRPFGTLSGGQQQRVSIARALVSDPELLILDEPSTGVDMVAQEEFYRLLAQLRNESGLAAIMVSHDIGVITAYADVIACLNRQLHYHGDPRGCFAREIMDRTYGEHVQVVVHDLNCPTCKANNNG